MAPDFKLELRKTGTFIWHWCLEKGNLHLTLKSRKGEPSSEPPCTLHTAYQQNTAFSCEELQEFNTNTGNEFFSSNKAFELTIFAGLHVFDCFYGSSERVETVSETLSERQNLIGYAWKDTNFAQPSRLEVPGFRLTSLRDDRRKRGIDKIYTTTMCDIWAKNSQLFNFCE